MTDCACPELPDAFYLDDAPEGFAATLERTAAAADWTCVHRCSECGALWAIDEWDKYRHQVAARVPDIDDWHAASREQRRRLLIDSQGGEILGTSCIWRGCERPKVNGVELCAEHLMEEGATR